MFTLVRVECDYHRCHNKTPREEMRLGWEWRHARKWWAGILGDFWKKQLVEIRCWARPVEIWSWTRRVHLGLRDAPRVRWVWWNGQSSKNCVSLSSCRKPKSQESNKSFVPELLRVISVSGFLCMWPFYRSVYFTLLYICIFHVFAFGYITDWLIRAYLYQRCTDYWLLFRAPAWSDGR